MKARLCLFLFLCLTIPPGAQAAELYGLAMHGDPKYGPGDTHMDYANPDAPKGGILKQAAIGTFDTLNPYSIKGKAAQGLNLTTDRLMARVWDEPFTMYPLIAEKIEVPEDRSSLTVHLNPSARFHDNSPITADDVLFSFETLKNEGRPNMRRIYKLAKSAEKLDEQTVKFSFGGGYDRETVMIFTMMPVLSKTWWQGRTFDATTLDPPLSSGPYKIKSVDPGRRIVYERVADYWAKDLLPNAGHHNFDEIIYDYYRDDTVAFEAFKTGNLNLRREWDAGRWNNAYDFPALSAGQVMKEALPHGRPDRVRAFIFNTRRPPFDDIRVRQALDLAFDFDWVNKTLFHNQYKRIDSFFPNTDFILPTLFVIPWLDHGIVLPRRKDPGLRGDDACLNARERMKKADALLKEAGWIVENGKRVRQDNPAEEMTFEILLDDPGNEKIALALTRNLKRLGITATVRVLDTAAYRGRLNDYDFDMTLYYWLSTLSPGTEQYLYWSCEAAEQPARWNYAGICDPEVDRLSQEIAQTQTREDLVAKTRALDEKLLAGHYMIPLYYNAQDYVAHWNTLNHPEVTPLYGTVIETWWANDK